MFANIKKIAVYLHTEFSGCSTVRLARHVRDVEVGSSNLLTPTSKVPKKEVSIVGTSFCFGAIRHWVRDEGERKRF